MSNFKVFTLKETKENEFWTHWAEGLSMYIEKDGISCRREWGVERWAKCLTKSLLLPERKRESPLLLPPIPTHARSLLQKHH